MLTGIASISSTKPRVRPVRPSASDTTDTERAEIWRDLCFRDYYLSATKEYGSDDVPQEPDTWKTRYFVRKYRAPDSIFDIDVMQGATGCGGLAVTGDWQQAAPQENGGG